MPVANSYLGKEVIAGNGASQAAQSMPDGTIAFWVESENGVAYVTINGVAAPQDASGRVPYDGIRYFGPYNNITSIGVYCDVGVNAYLRYES